MNFPSELRSRSLNCLDCLVFCGSKVKLQLHILDPLVNSSEVTLISWSALKKRALVAWFNFDLSFRCFNTSLAGQTLTSESLACETTSTRDTSDHCLCAHLAIPLHLSHLQFLHPVQNASCVMSYPHLFFLDGKKRLLNSWIKDGTYLVTTTHSDIIDLLFSLSESSPSFLDLWSSASLVGKKLDTVSQWVFLFFRNTWLRACANTSFTSSLYWLSGVCVRAVLQTVSEHTLEIQ